MSSSNSSSSSSDNEQMTTRIALPDLRPHVAILIMFMLFCIPVFISKVIPQSFTATVMMFGWLLASLGNLYIYARDKEGLFVFNAIMSFINGCLFAGIVSIL